MTDFAGSPAAALCSGKAFRHSDDVARLRSYLPPVLPTLSSAELQAALGHMAAGENAVSALAVATDLRMSQIRAAIHAMVGQGILTVKAGADGILDLEITGRGHEIAWRGLGRVVSPGGSMSRACGSCWPRGGVAGRHRLRGRRPPVRRRRPERFSGSSAAWALVSGSSAARM